MAKKIYLAFLWHQHQPFYKNLKTGKAVLPWVRLHATKDYYDMVAVLDDFPKIRLTINLVPSLLVQLQDFAENRSTDPWLEKSLIPATDLTQKDQCWILENFFFCNWETMIFPNARYAELFEKRGKSTPKEKFEMIRTYFNHQDYLDLQVWFNLAWMDPLLQEKDPLIASLYKKGSQFSENEKWMLLEKQREICRLVIEKHKELWQRGQIEISTTPFYHPILPLLCDTDSAQMALPGSLKPKERFQHPEDAIWQVERSIQFMENLFGKKPIGMWPSEGSVSEEAVSILQQAGIQWAATDEGILFRSLGMEGTKIQQESLYQPYGIKVDEFHFQTHGIDGGDGGGGGEKDRFQMVFRNRFLSDSIGFVYARMNPREAVEDLTNRILRIADSIPESENPPLVTIALDGENCWESYMRDGTDFIKTLYGTLSDHPRIETTTIGDFIQNYPTKKELKKLWSGSWINSDFGVWIGHPEDNRAWEFVNETRRFLIETAKKNSDKIDEKSIQMAWESLYISEGSDWCWWYGDQNSTAQDEVFDELFREHLKNVYRFLGEEPPQKLSNAIKQKKREQVLPVDLITPKIDGLVGAYYEWRAGGFYRTYPASSVMHQSEVFLTSFHYGFNLKNLYLRLDTKVALEELDLDKIKIKVNFIEPLDIYLQIHWKNRTIQANFVNKEGEKVTLNEVAAKKVIEIALPFNLLLVKENEPIEFVIQIIKDDIEIERWPHQYSILIKRPTQEFGSDFWFT